MSTELAHLLAAPAFGPRHPVTAGVVIGTVVNNKDLDGLGRVKVKFPWLNDLNESAWARIAAPMAGDGQGAWFLPEIDDEVLLAFEHGDIRFPYVIGCLWNGVNKPPADNADGENNVRLIKSRSGHVIRLNDKNGQETVEIIDATGKNKIVIDTASNAITISATGNITLSAPKGEITLAAKNINLNASSDALMTAEGDLRLAADGDAFVEGKTVNLN